MGPKAKKRRRTDRREKEKPLLAVQGLLRLEHCFIKSNNDDAEVMEVQVGEEKKKITLAPDNDMGKSEHDMVGYKAGYDTGPVNPLPQDEREEEIYQKRKKIDDANEYFEEMKKETEEKNEQRKAVWEDAALSEAERKEKAENPQDFNGWVYLVQACETVDIIDEIRTVYNAFLPLFPYCYAYWKRYS